ncbi:phosphotransferase [Sporomusa sp. KB1]|jgi:homoserine kinase type II|uniref:phosphotransferase n=1 Tax=Sporomusa sp. KB1 TaxID=943346 RepID=UPI0011A45203|nr:phosphotransferase [Sporomusa sp. KB1]TWH47574.1 homoserine kinase type II [Sporomusa sp. KB1]
MEDKIIADLKKSYAITSNEITPVTGGLMNLKWKITTDKGELLVKQYSTKRFRREQIDWIESSLHRQIILKKRGVPCPFLWQREGRVIRWLDDETAYMVMDFHSGKTETSDTITIMQMRSLGSTCAVMHRAFSQLPMHSVESLPVFGGYTIDLLWENFNSRMTNCSPEAHVEYRKALLAQEPILKQLRPEFFDKFPKGFAHEDFQPGNILFDADCVSAVIDFDRNCYSYIWHDIGRAILSFALEGNTISIRKIYAFLEGYTQHSALTLHNIADALRLSWCIETPWWIQPNFFGECDKIPKRFKDEMLWLTEHWFEIDSILCL